MSILWGRRGASLLACIREIEKFWGGNSSMGKRSVSSHLLKIVIRPMCEFGEMEVSKEPPATTKC